MGDSLRPYLKMQNLFVRDITRDASPAVVLAYLQKLGGTACKVVLPLEHGNDSKHIGQAYLNFNTYEESKKVLEKFRFSIKFKDQTAKLMYAALDKDRVYGPWSYKFQVIVKNLSEEVDVKMLYDFFLKFGEIYQCKADIDHFGQYYGQVTYIDEECVELACAGADQTRWQSSVIQVHPHHKANLAYKAEKSLAPPPESASTSQFPPLGSSASSGLSRQTTQHQGSSTSGSSSSQPPALPPPTVSLRQQQQQQQQQDEQQDQPVNFALESSSGSSSLPVPLPFSQPVVVPQPPPVVNPVPVTSVALVPDSAPLSPLDVPVVMPFAVAEGSRSAVGLGAPGSVGPFSSPAMTGPSIGGVGRETQSMQTLTLGPGLNLGSSGGTIAAASALPVATGPLGDSAAHLPGRLGTHHLLQTLERLRGDGSRPHTPGSDPVAGSAVNVMNGAGLGVSVAAGGMGGYTGNTGVGLAAGLAGHAAGVTPSSVAHGDRHKVGVLRGVLQSLEHISEALCCPITHELFVNPVVAADGITYERAAIVNWLTNHDTSPMTNAPMTNFILHPNNLVKVLIAELL